MNSKYVLLLGFVLTIYIYSISDSFLSKDIVLSENAELVEIIVPDDYKYEPVVPAQSEQHDSVLHTVVIKSLDMREHRCLVETIYGEALGEDFIGKYLVADTVLNRVRDSRFPNTICKVVNEPKQYYPTKSIEIRDKAMYAKIVSFAKHAMENGTAIDDQILFFHSLDKTPKYFQTLTFVREHGGHKFYK